MIDPLRLRQRPGKLAIAALCLGVSLGIAVPWLLALWAVGLISF